MILIKLFCFRKKNDPLHIQAYMKISIGNQSVWLPESQIEELKLHAFAMSKFPLQIENVPDYEMKEAQENKEGILTSVKGDPKTLINRTSNEDTPFCIYCSKEYKTITSLKRHCKLKHKIVMNNQFLPQLNGRKRRKLKRKHEMNNQSLPQSNGRKRRKTKP